jgi:aspartate/methionine/tyrosine aminotransferase
VTRNERVKAEAIWTILASEATEGDTIGGLMPKAPATVFAGLGTTIFESMSRLAETHRAINLGQGFPDEGGPSGVVEEARSFLLAGNNQYPPMAGLVTLREAIARHEDRCYGLTRDPKTDVLVTSGATEALASALLGLVSPGDEVIVFEPLYDSYVPIIRRAGGVPVPVRLEPPSFRLDPAALARAVSERTRVILINDPMNPAAKAFDRAELEAVVRVADSADAIILCDEVYEHLVYGREHVPIATLPGAGDRTLKVGSAGKIFSMTGWKVGWLTGPAALVSVVARAHQYLTFTTPPNLQAGVAWGLDNASAWVDELTRTLGEKRDKFAAGLTKLGMSVLPATGTYFLNVSLHGTEWEGRDAEYCRHLTEHRGVAAIPLSAFYVGEPVRDVVRFCFAKRYEVLDGALARLAHAAR